MLCDTPQTNTSDIQQSTIAPEAEMIEIPSAFFTRPNAMHTSVQYALRHLFGFIPNNIGCYFP